uniref:Uncharacterized protein n=1 Tax=Arundo donax TaxID=35708 RepID=A0A0A9HNR8_ARUDO
MLQTSIMGFSFHSLFISPPWSGTADERYDGKLHQRFCNTHQIPSAGEEEPFHPDKRHH